MSADPTALAKVTKRDQRRLKREDREELAVEAYGYGFTKEMAANAAGIPVELLDEWLEKGLLEDRGRNKAFMNRINRSRDRTLLIAMRALEESYLRGTTETTITVNADNTKVIRKVVKPPDTRNATWVAERLAPLLYGRRQAIEHVHSGQRKQHISIQLVETPEPVDYIPPPEHRDVIDAQVVSVSTPKEIPSAPDS